jgi:hypothetical protein
MLAAGVCSVLIAEVRRCAVHCAHVAVVGHSCLLYSRGLVPVDPSRINAYLEPMLKPIQHYCECCIPVPH